jgi:hypothetical protein
MNVAAHASPARTDAALQTAYQPLVILFVSVAAGICTDHLLGSSPAAFRVADAFHISWFAISWWFAAACLTGWWFACRRWAKVAALLLVFAASATGAAWHHARWSMFGGDEVGSYAELESRPVCVEAVARDTPERVRAPGPGPRAPRRFARFRELSVPAWS